MILLLVLAYGRMCSVLVVVCFFLELHVRLVLMEINLSEVGRLERLS